MDVVSALHGRVARDNVTRGIVVGVSGFTSGPASSCEFADSNHQITLVDGLMFVEMANQYLGFDWPHRLDFRIASERNEQKRSLGTP